jgi:L-threonylcarbamoyladenylate synthase
MTSSKLLVGTSANFSQVPSSKRFIDLDPKLVTECDAVLSKKTFSESKGESTIVDISNEAHPQIIRTGALPKNKIIEAINHNL